jgi:hypothetical protein
VDYTISLAALFWIGAGVMTMVGVVNFLGAPFKKLDEHEQRIKNLEEATERRRATDRYTTRALNAIVNHMIDGNGIDELKDVRKEYQNSIIDNNN